MNPGGTAKPRCVMSARLAPLPPLTSPWTATASEKSRTSDITLQLRPPASLVAAGDRDGERGAGHQVDEVVIAQIDRRDPQTDRRHEVDPEPPAPVHEIEGEKEARDRAVQAREHVHAVGAHPYDRVVPLGELPAGERHAELIRHGDIGPGSRNQRIAEKADAVQAEQADAE